MAIGKQILRWGDVAVPYTSAWTGEEEFRVDLCPFAKAPAICQLDARGTGKPRFGKPHSQRQREVISRDLCDLCGRPLKGRTKVSLSQARSNPRAVVPMDVLQVEPMLHRECARESMRFCPSLKDQLASGDINIRHVTSHRVQFAIMGPEFVSHYVPGYQAKPTDRIIGAAKVQLVDWVDRDLGWLDAA